MSPSGSGTPNGEIPGSNENVGATDGQTTTGPGPTDETGQPCPNNPDPAGGPVQAQP